MEQMKANGKTRSVLKRVLSLAMVLAFCLSIAQQGVLTAYAAEDAPQAESSSQSEGSEPAEAKDEEKKEESKEESKKEESKKGGSVKAQDGPYDATITVQDQSGSALSGVAVSLSGVGAPKDTDASGKATFTELTGESHTVTVPGTVTVSGKNYAVKPGDSWSVSESKTTVVVTLYQLVDVTVNMKKEALNDAKTALGDSVEAEKNDYSVSVKEGTKLIGDNKTEVHPEKGMFTLTNALKGTNYTVEVESKTDSHKVSNDVELNNVQGTETPTAVLKLKRFDVKLNDNKVRDAYYGETYTIFKADAEESAKTSQGFELVGIRYDGTTHDFGDNDSLQIKNITADKNVVSVYQYTATFHIDEHGVVKHGDNDNSIANNGTVTARTTDNGIAYKVTSDEGYYIKEVKENETVKDIGDEPTSYSEKVQKRTTITATFKERKFDVTYSLALSSNENGEVKVGDATLTKSSSSTTVGVDATPAPTRKDDGKDYYTLTKTIKLTDESNYEIDSVKQGDKNLTKDGDNYTLSDFTGATTVTITVKQKDHTITYYNPLEEDGKQTQTQIYHVEDGTVTLKTLREVTGFTAVGWKKSLANEETAKTDDFIDGAFSTTGENKINGDLALYAVYKVNMNNVDSNIVANESSRCVGAERQNVTGKGAIGQDNSWFGGNVTLTLPTNDNQTYTVTGATLVSGNNYQVARTEDSVAPATVTITGACKDCSYADGRAVKYATAATSVTVKIDGKFPELNPDEIKATTTQLTASDEGSGVDCVQWAETNIVDGTIDEKDLEEKGGANKIKAALRGLTWTDINESGGGYPVQTPLSENYVVYRVVDKAGNDTYSVFDTSVPQIEKVQVSYSKQGKGAEELEIKNVDLSSGDFKLVGNGALRFQVKITDNMLVYFPKDSNEQYGGVTLSLKYKENEESATYKVKTLDTVVEEKTGWLELFNNQWVAECTLEPSNLGVGENDSVIITGVKVEATDVMENKYAYESNTDSYIVVDRTKPDINVEYSYTDGIDVASEANPKLTEEQLGSATTEGERNPVYSRDNITATITVSGAYFDTLGTAAFIVKDGEATLAEKKSADTAVTGWTRSDDGTSWTRSDDGTSWTGTVTLTEEREHHLTVEATSCAGNETTYNSSETLVVDKTVPVIAVKYDYYNIAETANENDGTTSAQDDNKSEAKKDLYHNGNKKDLNGNKKDLVATITVTDDYLDPYQRQVGEHRAGKGGHTAVSAAVDGAEAEITWTSQDAKKWVGTVNLGKEMKQHALKIVAKDQAGKQSEYVNNTLNIDNDAPTLDSVTAVKVDENKVLNKLTFGLFFNGRVKLTVKATDKTDMDPDPSSGVYKVRLSYPGTEGDPVTTECTATVASGKAEKTFTAEFYVPYPKKNADAAENELISPWEAKLSLEVIDCVGNSSTKKLDEVQLTDDIHSKYVLYENKVPTVTDTTADYYSDGTNNWLKKGTDEHPTHFTALVQDEKETSARSTDETPVKLASGLKEVELTLKHNNDSGTADNVMKVELKDATVKEDGTITGTPTMTSDTWLTPNQTGNYVYTVDVDIPYDAFTNGENTVTIYAEDNCGNNDTWTYTVYKDGTLPTLTSLNLENPSGRSIQEFGNFYNEAVTINVGVLDGQYTSGIASVKLVYVNDDHNVNGNPKDNNPKLPAKTSGANSGTFGYTVPYTDNTEGHLKVVVTDNVGNQITFGENSNFQISNNVDANIAMLTSEEYGGKTNIHKNHMMFEKTPIRIQDAINRTAEFTCTGDKPDRLWFNSQDIPMIAQLDDVGSKKSGLNQVKVEVNGNAVTNTKDGVPYTKTIGGGYDVDKKTTHDEANFNLKDNSGREGENTIELKAWDNANNKSSESFKVYVDTTKPEVTSFNVGGNDAKNVTVTDYGYFFQKDTEVTVMTRDAKPSSGIKRIYFKAVPASNGKPSTRLDTQTGKEYLTQCDLDGTSTSATFTVKANFKGQIYAYVEDNVGNTSLTGDMGNTANWKHPDGPILETQSLHNDLSKIQAELVTQTGSRDKKGQPLYKADAQVKLTVEDPYSGIQKVQYKVVSECDTGKNVDVTSEVKGHSLPGWSVDATDLNLVTKVSRTITVPNNSNDIKVFVYLTDNAGNTSNNEKNPLIFSIDKDAPQITVRYVPADEGDDPTHTGYFKTDRKMTVTVKERNFDPNLVKVTATKNNGGYNANGGFGGETRSVENGIEYFTYTMTHTYHDDGDYTFAIAATDRAGNATEDGQVDYGSAGAKTVAKVFTIDQTLPQITVDISGTRGDDIYYKGDVTITVHVLEHNFDPNRYEIAMSLHDPQSGAEVNGARPTSGPSNSGDSWTYSYTFSQEYKYQVTSVKVTDKAGNESQGYNGSYHGEFFVVDKTAPVIQMFTSGDLKTKLDHTATNQKKITPAVVITDTNLDAKSVDHYTVTLTGNNNGSDLMGKAGYKVKYQPEAADRLVISFENITGENEEMIDDIYTLRVGVRDKAGVTSEGSAVFSINRYGSTYMVSQQTNELVKKYYTNQSEDVEIIQINAAPISDQHVTVSKNNTTSQDLVEGQDYNMVYTTPGQEDGSDHRKTDSNWYECKYTLLAKNFMDEVEYSVAIYSKDKAANSLTNFTPNRKSFRFDKSNRRDNAVLDEKKGNEDVTAPVVFNVDKTNPQASFINQKDSAQHFVSSYEIPVTASDDKALDHVNVLVDGEIQETVPAEAVLSGGASYLLGSDSRMRTVTLVAVDKATNESEQTSIKIQVTRDPIAWYLNNLPAKLITALLALGAIGFFVFKRRAVGAGAEAE